MQLNNPIGHDRSRQNKSMRDEELIKAEHVSSTNGPRVQFGQFNQKGPLCLKYCKHVLANSIRIYQEHTLRDRLQRSGKRDIASFDELIIFLKKHRSPTAYVLDRASCGQSDKFLSSCQEKAL